MGPRRLQLYASTARTFKTDAAVEGCVATLVANKASIHMGNHGSELNPENAIGTTDYCLGHGNLESDGESKNKHTVKRRVTAALAVR
jgi:hypothetical protein